MLFTNLPDPSIIYSFNLLNIVLVRLQVTHNLYLSLQETKKKQHKPDQKEHVRNRQRNNKPNHKFHQKTNP